MGCRYLVSASEYILMAHACAVFYSGENQLLTRGQEGCEYIE